MEPVPTADLERVARTVAGRSPGLDFDDCKQDIWEKFVRFQPWSIGGAWVIARNVRNSLWKRERYRRHPSLEEGDLADPALDMAEMLTIKLALAEVGQLKDRDRRLIRGAIMGQRMTPAERVGLHRARRKLRRRLGLGGAHE